MLTKNSNNYTGRYPYLTYRKNVWYEIINFINKDAGKIDTLIELGTGYCDFINQFPAKRKIGFDLNPEMRQYANTDVDIRIEDATKLNNIENETIDLVFASNFLEHLNKTAHEQLMPRIREVLKKSGKLILIQPNYRLCKLNYFNDKTHQTIFSDDMIGMFLDNFGFSVIKLIPGLLPFSMKTRLPKWTFLVRMYLNSPIKPMAAQMYIVAKRI